MGMREKYQSLALADLKEIAKSRGIKGTSGMKKADIIDAMVALDEKEEKEQTAAPKAETKEETAEKPRTAHEKKKSREKAAEEKKTGCLVCLDSCPVGIVSNATYTYGAVEKRGEVKFKGNASVLPADNTLATVTFKITE